MAEPGQKSYRIDPQIAEDFDAFTVEFQKKLPRTAIGEMVGAAFVLLMGQPEEEVLKTLERARSYDIVKLRRAKPGESEAEVAVAGAASEHAASERKQKKRGRRPA